jgi:hypothetical protein
MQIGKEIATEDSKTDLREGALREYDQKTGLWRTSKVSCLLSKTTTGTVGEPSSTLSKHTFPQAPSPTITSFLRISDMT